MENQLNVQDTIVYNTISIVLGALTFVAALAWHDAFSNTIQKTQFLNEAGPWMYAIMITLLAVGIGLLFEKQLTQKPRLDIASLTK